MYLYLWLAKAVLLCVCHDLENVKGTSFEGYAKPASKLAIAYAGLTHECIKQKPNNVCKQANPAALQALLPPMKGCVKSVAHSFGFDMIPCYHE
jgi:hypothetical protein